MTQPTDTNDQSQATCAPETLLAIKTERLRHAEHQADVYLGALLELQEKAKNQIEQLNDRIAELEMELANVEPSSG